MKTVFAQYYLYFSNNVRNLLIWQSLRTYEKHYSLFLFILNWYIFLKVNCYLYNHHRLHWQALKNTNSDRGVKTPLFLIVPKKHLGYLFTWPETHVCQPNTSTNCHYIHKHSEPSDKNELSISFLDSSYSSDVQHEWRNKPAWVERCIFWSCEMHI